jgi:uncharacterized protein YuzE
VDLFLVGFGLGGIEDDELGANDDVEVDGDKSGKAIGEEGFEIAKMCLSIKGKIINYFQTKLFCCSLYLKTANKQAAKQFCLKVIYDFALYT